MIHCLKSILVGCCVDELRKGKVYLWMKYASYLVICDRVKSLGDNGSFGILLSGYDVMYLCRHSNPKFYCISFKGEKDESCKECHNAITSYFSVEIYEFTIV